MIINGDNLSGKSLGFDHVIIISRAYDDAIVGHLKNCLFIMTNGMALKRRNASLRLQTNIQNIAVLSTWCLFIFPDKRDIGAYIEFLSELNLYNIGNTM